MSEQLINPFIDVKNIDPEPTLLGGLTTDGASQNFFGVLNINNNRVQIDGNNGRIVIKDETGIPRIVMGNV